MKFAKQLKQLSVLPFIFGALLPAAHAHPGHIANESVHGLLHIEHIISLVAASAIAFAVYTLRNK